MKPKVYIETTIISTWQRGRRMTYNSGHISKKHNSGGIFVGKRSTFAHPATSTAKRVVAITMPQLNDFGFYARFH